MSAVVHSSIYDVMKFVAADMKSYRIDLGDAIFTSLADVELDDETTEQLDQHLAVLNVVVNRFIAKVDSFGRPGCYSDGTAVESCVQIKDGVVQSVVWAPNPASQGFLQWTAPLPSVDPDTPSPGVYKVTVYLHTQTIEIEW